MTIVSRLVLASGLIACSQQALAQDLTRYRNYALESSVSEVLTASGARASDLTVIHERPAMIRQLQWRAPYSVTGAPVDPVRTITFTFHNDALYQVVVLYHRDRTQGLTDGDLVASLSATYGPPLLAATSQTLPAADGEQGSVVVARWETPTAVLALVRGSHLSEFQLTLTSTSLSAVAREAVRESLRLDTVEAPARHEALRQKIADDAAAAGDKIRDANKSAFRP